MLQKIKRWFGFNSDPSAQLNFRPDAPYAYPPFFNPYTGHSAPPWLNQQIGPQVPPAGMPSASIYPPYYGYPYNPINYLPVSQNQQGPMFPHADQIQMAHLLPTAHASINSKSEILMHGKQPDIKNDNVKKEADVSTVILRPENTTGSSTLQGSAHLTSKSEVLSEWPNGYERREYILGTEPHKWKETKYVWRSQGQVSHNGLRVELRVCLGVLSCSNSSCGRHIRPKTNPASRKNQISNRCQLCHSEIGYHTCSARTYHYKMMKNGQVYLVWEHEGNHPHQRPPGGPLSASEEEALDVQVTRNPTASAHVLRTGSTAPGSVPLPEISAILSNPQAARYQIAQSQARLGIATAAASKGGLSVLKALYDLQSELGEPFIIDSSVHGPSFLMLQTPFMQSMLCEVIQNWKDNPTDGPSMGRRGFVTDGDHSYFREGVLNITCVFSTVTLSWIPVLYTWILRQDIAHHRPHFRHISKSVVEYTTRHTITFEPKYLLHVFDFSAAQRAAHAEEYADAVISMTLGYSSLSDASKKIERNLFLQQALESERGCSFHFWESAERLKANGALIPQEKASDFTQLLRILVDSKTTRPEFDETIQKIDRNFHAIMKWLTWWLRPTFRSLIFPAYSSLDPAIAVQVPSTSNAAEHSHSLLHRAVGSDQDLIPGIKRIYLHMKELESQYDSIKAGHYNPNPPREHRRPAKPTWDSNDGRPPDTEAALNPRGLFDPLTVNEHRLSAYKWRAPNSCFVDNSLELWFRAYAIWPEETKASFLENVPSRSFLSSLFNHYDRRFKHMYQETSRTAFCQNLDLMQTITLNCVFERWKLYSDPNSYGCAKTWLVHAVKDGDPERSIQGYFGLTYQIHRRCSNGHISLSPHTISPEVLFTINNSDMQIAHKILGTRVTTTGYFKHYIPRSRGGNHAGGTTPIHLHQDEECTTSLCMAPASIDHVVTEWPQIFTINADVHRVDPEKLKFENTFSIPDEDGSPVTYDLVGRVIHVDGNHFVSEIRCRGQSFSYNNMNGKLILSKDTHLLEVDNIDSVCYVYTRTTSNQKTSKSVDNIKIDYKNHLPSLKSMVQNSTHTPSSARTPFNHPHSLPIQSPPILDQYPVEDYQICGDCERSKSEESSTFEYIKISCTLCDRVWHEECLTIHDLYVDGVSISDDAWACPACIIPHGGLWDREMIGQYILLQPVLAGRFYPAKVLGRSAPKSVLVEWYDGNVYDANDMSAPAQTVFTPLECIQAKYREPFHNYTAENVGTIKWPIRLEESAADKHNYVDKKIRHALEEAYGIILEIVLGERQHPIVELYISWITNRPKSIKLLLQHNFNFMHQFTMHVLPGDASLVEPFQLYLLHAVKDSKTLVEKHWIHVVANILFNLVIIRTYLGRQPCDDEQIFYLAYTGSAFPDIAPDDVYAEAKRGSISRLITLPEKVAMASGSAIRTIGIHRGLRRQIDENDNLAGEKIVEALSNSKTPYMFFNTTKTGMVGGRTKFVASSRIERNILRPTISEEDRPKPRARGKAATQILPDGTRIIKRAISDIEVESDIISREVDTGQQGRRKSKRLRKA